MQLSGIMRVFATFMGATGNANGSIYAPNTLNRAQLLQYNEELTRTYGHAYVAALNGQAKR